MDCIEANELIERLADGEPANGEAEGVRAHVESCDACAEHLELIELLPRASKRTLPEPPDAYWDSFPDRVMARIREESAPAPRRLAPELYRFGALAAGLLVAAGLGLMAAHPELWRETTAPAEESTVAESVTPEPPATPAAPGGSDSTDSLEDSVAPPAARDEPRAQAADPKPRPARSGPASATARGPEAEPAAAPPAPPRAAPVPAASEARAAEAAGSARRELPSVGRARQGAPQEQVQGQESVSDSLTAELNTLGYASPAEADAADADAEFARIRERASRDCAAWRGYLEEFGAGARATDARYELARCSVAAYRREVTEARRQQALADIQAFLGEESEGPRRDEMEDEAEALRSVPR